jgi:hypothetical protein
VANNWDLSLGSMERSSSASTGIIRVSSRIGSKKGHAKQWLVFPENMGPYLSSDETALSKG